MTPLLSLPQWRGPIRQKSSTPFFPGAWPGTPSRGRLEEQPTQEDIEAFGNMEKPHESGSSPVLCSHQRLSPGFTGLPLASSLPPKDHIVNVSSKRHMNRSLSHADPSETPSASVQFPPPNRSSSLTCPNLLASPKERHNGGLSTQKPPRPPRNPSRTTLIACHKLEAGVHGGSPPESLLTRALCKPQEEERLSSPISGVAFPSSLGKQLNTDISSCALPSPSRASELLPLPPSEFASSFFPLSGKIFIPPCPLLPSSSLDPSIVYHNELPILPSPNLGPSLGSSRYVIAQHQSDPSSADMDAFGIAATDMAFDSRSVLNSISTSFHSASALETISNTTKDLAPRVSSLSLASSVDFFSNDDRHQSSQPHRTCDSQYSTSYTRGYRSGAPSPTCSFLERLNITRTTNSHVTAPHSRSAQNGNPGKSGNLFAFGKVKRFGGRIRNFFRGKNNFVGNLESEIGVRTHTAVTAVEYTSDYHKSNDGSRTQTTPTGSRISSHRPETRRQSMPTTWFPPKVSHPRPLRPSSLLAITKLSANTPIHSADITNAVGFSPPCAQMPTWERNASALRPSSTKATSSSCMAIPAQPERSSRSHRGFRTHSQATPEPRGFEDHPPSLGSVIGEAIRTAITPHPSLPQRCLTRCTEHPERLHGTQPELWCHDFFQPPSGVRSSTETTARLAQFPKRRSRGFSLSSAISRKAAKARSMMGRSTREVPPSDSALIKDNQTLVPLITSVSSVSDLFTTGITTEAKSNRPTYFEERTESSGCAEYEPNLVLDRMSFATTELQSTLGSADTDCSLNPHKISGLVHPVEIAMATGGSSFVSVGNDGTPNRSPGQGSEYEREFMRTLGLEFDEIVRRASD